MKRRHSSVLGNGPKHESYKQWERVLPSSGRHLIASFDNSVVFCYINTSPIIAEKLQQINQLQHYELENLFGPFGSRICIYLDFLDAAYSGMLKQKVDTRTSTLCIHRSFFDLLLRKAVRTGAIATAGSKSASDVIRISATNSKATEYCGIDWQSVRNYDGNSLTTGPKLLSLIISGGWLRRLLTKNDGLCYICPIHEMIRYFDQDYSKKHQIILPKQRHYQPNPPSDSQVPNGAVKWTKSNWKQHTERHQRLGDDGDGDGIADLDMLKSGITAWNDNTSGIESKGSQDRIDQLGLCDLCFLCDFKFDKDRKEVCKKAWERGTKSIVILPSGTLSDCERAIQLCENTDRHQDPHEIFDRNNKNVPVPEENTKESGKAKNVQDNIPANMFLSVVAGIHPDDASTWSSNLNNQLKHILLSKSICAVGVIGLDYHRMLSSEAYQMICFQDQLLLCKERSLTAIVTEKWASEECLEVLNNPKFQPERILILGFEGSSEQVSAYLDIGAYIGISGDIANEGGKGLRALLRQGAIPLERLCVYSGAPFHHPGNTREGDGRNGKAKEWKRNEPKYLSKICKTVAKCFGRGEDEIRFCCTYNHTFLFRNDEVGDIFGTSVAF